MEDPPPSGTNCRWRPQPDGRSPGRGLLGWLRGFLFVSHNEHDLREADVVSGPREWVGGLAAILVGS